MKNIYTIILSLISAILFSQTLITEEFNDQQLTVNANAVLELKSITHDKGLVLPRVALSALNLSTPFSAHIEGMTIYNTQTSGTGNNRVTPGLYYNDGAQWLKIIAQTPVVGDIKYSSNTADHQGWYLLNGRLINTLPSVAQSNASSLGLATNLPNSDDRYLKAKTVTEVLGAAGGNSSIVLTQANLPNVTFTGTALSAGAHTHTYNDRGNSTVESAELNNVSKVDNTSANRVTGTAGAHTHTFSVSTGGGGTPINYEPSYLVANIFVYLGN